MACATTMIWRLATSSKLFARIVAILGLLGAPGTGATLTGQIQLIQSGNPSVTKKADYSGVVVWLTSSTQPVVRASGKRVTMLQKDKRFVPHILPIEVGTSVEFPNLDPIFHNAFSNYNGQIFDVALYPPGTSKTVKFDRPGIVRVFCNIHPTMSAIILALTSPYFATTGHRGEYKIANVPPGTYDVHFFHERATPETLNALTRRVVISNDLCLPVVSISEAGYLPVAHKNKYGRDYPPVSEEVGGYKPPLK